MQLGKVIGTVTLGIIYEGLEGVPILLVQPLDKYKKPDGSPIAAADPTHMAGRGELVYYESSREAALTLDPWFVPVDDAIVGIVDNINLLPQEDS